MVKELYIKREQLLKELQELSFLVSILQTFLIENEKNFKRDKSIEALKKIKTYFEFKRQEAEVKEHEYREITRKFYSTCSHDIAIKKGNMDTYECLICNWSLGNNIPDQSLISIDTSKDYQVAYTVEKILGDIVHSDKDLIETMSDVIEDMQYDRDIKVYRRVR